MDPKETQKQRITRVARELGPAIREQARGRWTGLRTAERNEPGRHVWRFRSGPGGSERFLHIEHRAMMRGKDPAARLLERLEAEQWLDRLHDGPETALLLSRDGQLAAFPAR
ncbi:MAG TPA: hypothetical protein VGR37_14765 [Longimicrobiaceae bacterium]|nr:hypothetical protein [Longimicrobiaceae bacterium]